MAISRFGTMFFSDPTAAFTNVAQHLNPKGRLCIVTWQPLDTNEWLARPRCRTLGFGNLPDGADPGGPGMFAQSDPDTIELALVTAGFDGIAITPAAMELNFGRSVDDAVDYLAELRTRPSHPRHHPHRPARRSARRRASRPPPPPPRRPRCDSQCRRVGHHRRHPLTAARPVRIYDHRAEPDSEALTSEDAVRLYTTPVHCSPVCSP